MARMTLLTVYDVLHYLCLNGSRVKRDDIVNYLHRAATPWNNTTFESRLRAFERFKNHLRQLGIHFTTELDNGETWFVLPKPDKALANINNILDTPAVVTRAG